MSECGRTCRHMCAFSAADLPEGEQPNVPVGVNLGGLMALAKQCVQASPAPSRANDSSQV